MLFLIYNSICRYGPDLTLEWDLIFLILDKIHNLLDSYDNNLFEVLKETIITIEGS